MGSKSLVGASAIAALVLATYVGILDAIFGDLTIEPGWGSLPDDIHGLGLTTLSVVIVYSLSLVPTLAVGRRLGLDGRGLIVAVACFWCVLATFSIVGVWICLDAPVFPTLTSLSEVMLFATRGGVFLFLLLASATVAYCATPHVFGTSPRRERAVSLCLAVGFVFTATFLEVWVHRNAIEGFLSPAGIGLSLAYVVLVPAVVLAAWRPSNHKAFVAVGVLLQTLILGGALLSDPAIRLRPRAVSVRTPRATPPPDVPPVILVSIDTLRHDALSFFDSDAPPTPNLDEFARANVAFRNSYAAAPWTLPSMASILTGVSPDVHGVSNRQRSIPPGLPSLAERLADSGYRTAAIVNNSWLNGLAVGFCDFRQLWRPVRVGLGAFLSRLRGRRDTSRDLTALACDWLEANREQPFFLWVHYLDPHDPYEPPPDYQPGPLPGTRTRDSFAHADMRLARDGLVHERELPAIRALYAAEVRYVDDCFGSLIHRLKELGIYDRALIVVLSDHGEEFLDHGRFYHGHTLYAELLRVLLVIKPPGPPSPRIVECSISTTAVVPTILDLAGLPSDADDFSAESLRGSWEGGRPVAPVFSCSPLYYGDQEALVFGTTKYIRVRSTGMEQLFDLRDDPSERSPLASSAPARVAEARALLAAHERASAELRDRHGIESPADGVTPAGNADHLGAIGY